MTENGIIFLVFSILYMLLMVINYRAYTKYPAKLTEGALAGGILETKGPAWFIIIKMLFVFLIVCAVFLPLTTFLTIRYSYLLWGVLLGSVFLNLVRDCLVYRKVAKSEQKRLG